MRAVNLIGDDGAASLAPSLGRMAQLTTLDLSSTLRASAGFALWVDDCDRRLCNDVVCCGLGRLCAGLFQVVGLASAGPRGGGACRKLDRRSRGSVAGTESRKDGAADDAEPQLYAACIGGSWLWAGACERRQCGDDVACCGLGRLHAGL